MEKTYVAELKITIDEEVLEHKDGLEAIILDSLEEAPYQVDDLKIKEEEMNYEEKWEELKERLGDIIKRRLHGELSTCENCVLHCSTPDLAFDIDLSKI